MKTFIASVRMLVVLTIITGLIYPAVVTGLAQRLFSAQAGGSLVSHHGRAIGSSLIGQSFRSERYFWSRPSAVNYNPMPSGGSNLGPTSATLHDSVVARAARFGVPVDEVPSDLLFASGSGLDPDISPQAAYFQIARVVRGRGYTSVERGKVEELVRQRTALPVFRLLGEPRVNVLQLNLALDSLLP